MIERLVVIGGDAAGMSCASQARRRRSATDLAIVVFEATEWVSYSACGEPYFVSGEVPEVTDLVARTPEHFAAADIEVRLNHRVTAIDPVAKTVMVDTPQGTIVEPYDQLMYATGAAAVMPNVPGIAAQGVFKLHTLTDAVALRAAIQGATKAIVVGAGYVGLEVSEALLTQGLATVLVSSRSHVMNRSLDPDIAATATQAVRDHGIEVFDSARLTGVLVENGVAVGVDTTRGKIMGDLVVVATGVQPRTEIAAAAGISLGPTGAVEVDDHQRTNVSGIWSAGDCAESRNLITGETENPQLGTVANKQGRVAGFNIGGEEAVFPGVLMTAITKVMSTEIARTGLSEAEAHAAGIPYAVGMVHSTTTAGYMHNARPILIKVVAEKGSGRLLGAQIVGGEGSAKRIDVFATAIWSGVTGHDLAMTDLSYAPPFSGVWDVVMIAARRAADAATR